MTFFQYVTTHKLIISNLFKNGVVGTTIINDYEIYKYYDDLRNTRTKKRESILLCMSKFGVSRKKMYLLISKFEAQVV